jgi:hypothetical protein
MLAGPRKPVFDAQVAADPVTAAARPGGLADGSMATN